MFPEGLSVKQVQQLLSIVNSVGLHCCAKGSHIVAYHLFGCFSNSSLEVSSSTVTRKWKWLFLSRFSVISVQSHASMGQMEHCIQGLCWEKMLFLA